MTDHPPMTGHDLDPASWSCPAPVRNPPTVLLGHGSGGAMTAELIEQIFLPALGRPDGPLTDSAVLDLSAAFGAGGRLAFTTDAHVVRPLFFPGGCIGDLAVNGTVNDLAMVGARPIALSCAFVLEEGTDLAVVERVARAVGDAARAAGTRVVTGDTKVVEAGRGDGLYVTTAGIGLVPRGVDPRPDRAAPGDVVLLSGPIGAHGIAVLSVREGMDFSTGLLSDTAPLAGLVEAMLRADPDVHALRDPTRGGLAAALNEIAVASGVGIEIEDAAVPVPDQVSAVCSLLGLDPWCVANEGRLVALVREERAQDVLAALRAHPAGVGAVAVGRCTDRDPGLVVARSAYGSTRIVDLPLGEQLPRIC
ncbi:MAG: hydrogenase expression/formation protein HypE [Actinomycetota bacterium]|nr:hydrogenase expression/formation protein HypE [Actinomycetota bacterium]